MKHVLHDHGDIIHRAGAHGLFPVRGQEPDSIGFAAHGALEGRTPIGWHEFFPALRRRGLAVVLDDEAGAFELVARDAVPAPRKPEPPPSEPPAASS